MPGRRRVVCPAVSGGSIGAHLAAQKPRHPASYAAPSAASFTVHAALSAVAPAGAVPPAAAEGGEARGAPCGP